MIWDKRNCFMIFKWVVLWSLLIISLEAKKIVVDYVVEFGVIGQVGKVHTLYSDDNAHYIIDTNLSAVGMLAQKMTHHLKERHICKGFISKDGTRVVTRYQMIKSYGKYKSTTIYKVNHQSKKVTKQYIKWEKRDKGKDKKILDYTYTLGYYARSDMVTLFLNLDHYIQHKNKPKHYIFKAVGADREKGRVDVRIPRKKETMMMKSLLGVPKNGEWLMNLVMHRQLYHSKKGELMVRMGKDGIVQKAVLKDILFFGDIRIIKKN